MCGSPGPVLRARLGVPYGRAGWTRRGRAKRSSICSRYASLYLCDHAGGEERMMSEPIVQSAVDSALVAPSTGGEPDISALAVALDRDELVRQIGLLPASRWPWGVPQEVQYRCCPAIGSLIALW